MLSKNTKNKYSVDDYVLIDTIFSTDTNPFGEMVKLRL